MTEASAALAAIEARIADLVGESAALAAAIDAQSTLLRRLVEAATRPPGRNRVEELLEKILEYLELSAGERDDAPARSPRGSDGGPPRNASAAARDGEPLSGPLDAAGRRRR